MHWCDARRHGRREAAQWRNDGRGPGPQGRTRRGATVAVRLQMMITSDAPTSACKAAQMRSSLSATTRWLRFSSTALCCEEKSNVQAWSSGCRCFSQNSASHLHTKPKMPTFLRHVRQRDFFFCFFFAPAASTAPPAPAPAPVPPAPTSTAPPPAPPDASSAGRADAGSAMSDAGPSPTGAAASAAAAAGIAAAAPALAPPPAPTPAFVGLLRTSSCGPDPSMSTSPADDASGAPPVPIDSPNTL
mmetsp:Transcript_19456/g.68898  ORF Transcript_19456/g.68898 Transcript_19456/m.68898 type:complete len:245 (+) Transcript_19456:137-871(+)